MTDSYHIRVSNIFLKSLVAIQAVDVAPAPPAVTERLLTFSSGTPAGPGNILSLDNSSGLGPITTSLRDTAAGQRPSGRTSTGSDRHL